MGKGVMFMAFMWLITCLAGTIMAGSMALASTTLTADVAVDDTTIYVADTTNFSSSGIIQIGSEKIGYSNTTATTFVGSTAQPMIRGAQDTDAAVHSSGAVVRTVEGAMLNQSAMYNIAVLTDSSGTWAAITMPLAILRLIGNFLFLPLDFLGTDLAIITYIWAVIGIGMIVALALALAGGRRVG